MATGKGDCDEITRLAFLSASGLGAQNAVMVEMTWTNPKTKLFEGHSALVLIPENPLDAPLVFDFTYLHDGKQLESADLEKGLKKFYAEDAKNPDFKIAQFGTVTEVEASYYDKVGWQYSTIGNWEMTALAYEKAVGLVPDGFEYNRNLGFTYKKLKKYEKALEYYKKASETKEGKEDTETYSNIGDIYLSLKRYEEAGQTLKLALSLNPNRTLYETIGHNLATAMFKEGKRLMNEKNMTMPLLISMKPCNIYLAMRILNI